MLPQFLRYILYSGIFLVPLVVFNVSESMFFPYITGKNFTFRILVEIMAGAWILLALYKAEYRPRFSLILASFGALLVSMFVSDVLSPSPLKSFMSNFERMDGYITLAHTFLYFFITATVMRAEAVWDMFFRWSLALSTALAIYGMLQSLGFEGVSQGGKWRVDGTLGNSTYMAIYMLFNIAIAALVFIRAKTKAWRIASVAAASLFVLILFNTGTRGTVLGLGVGTLLGFAYIAIFGRSYPVFRKIAVGGIGTLVVLVGLFVTFKDSALVQNTPALERLTHITLEEGSLRFKVWGMAWEGVQERPVFGWGHESFNYTFNKHYDPAIHGAEEWYDRTHNIVFDWLIWGGFVGAFLYFGILAAAVYYLVVRPHLPKYRDAETVPFLERAVLFGLLAAYTVHNFFVFDNIVSYIYFAIILAYIHVHLNGTPIRMPQIQSTQVWRQVAVPAVVVVVGASVWMLNVPAMADARGLITAMQGRDLGIRFNAFQSLLEDRTLGTQEVREQLMEFTSKVYRAEDIPDEFKQRVVMFTEEQIDIQAVQKPGDARVYILAGNMYRELGMTNKALEQFEIAKTLTPTKQSLYHSIGFTYLMSGNTAEALENFAYAVELDQSKARPRVLYAYAGLASGNPEIYDDVLDAPKHLQAAAEEEFFFKALHDLGRWNDLIELYEYRIERHPDELDARTNLARAYMELGKTQDALRVLKDAMEDFPLARGELEKMYAEFENR